MAQRIDDAAARRIRVEMPKADVLYTLQALADLDPPVVHREHDARLDIEFWFAIEPGASAWLDGAPER
jgi:hypothetical protein